MFRLIEGTPVRLFVYGREYEVEKELTVPLEEW
jgi:hypothetical protein